MINVTPEAVMSVEIDQYCEAVPSDSTDGLRIGLVNNMPDSALEATETQFTRLLEAASGTVSVQLRFSYLPEIERAPAALARLRGSYWPIDELLSGGLDALIVTGAEPVAPSLRQERYWQRFIEVLNWAESNTYSSVWSCLAAHAAVERLDAIARRRLPQKCCGVFEHDVMAQHPLMRDVSAPLHTPQSRWNELPLNALRAAGYTILSASADTGANIFARQHRSLLIFFQGHPEYEGPTLLKEYRRDIERFLAGQQAHYPTLPSGYFSHEAVATLEAFKERALSSPVNARPSFPYAAVVSCVQHSWRAAAVKIYRNWLAAIANARAPAYVSAAI
jgi:homoserine O-succinyltransferase